MDCFPEDIRPGLFPIGRLDKDTEGLLLITDDGDFAFRMLRPEFGVAKRYFFRAFGEISEETGITRQGVMNCIKKCEQRLLELENELGLVERFTKLKADTEKLEAVVMQSSIKDEEKKEIVSVIADIKSRL